MGAKEAGLDLKQKRKISKVDVTHLANGPLVHVRCDDGDVAACVAVQVLHLTPTSTFNLLDALLLPLLTILSSLSCPAPSSSYMTLPPAPSALFIP